MKKIAIIVPIFIIFSILMIYECFKIKISPSEELNQSERIFEQKENLFFRYEIIRYYSCVNITEYIQNETIKDLGMNVDRTNLCLGRVPKGSMSEKTLNLTNRLNNSYKIKFYAFGNISQLIKPNKNLIIMPGETFTYTIIAETNVSTEPGNYVGEIDIVTIIPKNKIGKFFEKVI